MIDRKTHTVSNFSWFIAFCIWPLGAFIASIRVMGKRVFSVMLILFYFLYGFTYVVAGKDQDTYRTSQYFEEAAKLSFSDLWNKTLHLYELGNKPDIFQDLLQFVVSRFTLNPQIYFAITAILFAFIAALIFEDVLKSHGDHLKYNLFVLLVALFLLLVLSPGQINSFRHYLATALFLFSTYRYFNGGGVRYIFLLLTTPFIHFAFVMVIPLIVIYKMVGNRFAVYYVLIALSFVYADEVSDYVRNYAIGMDESALQYHVHQYTSDVYQRRVEELKATQYYILGTHIYFTTLLFLGIVIYHRKFILAGDSGLNDMYAMSLLIFALVNFFSQIESVANRFSILYQGFCCLLLISLYVKVNITAPVFLRVVFGLALIANSLIAIRILAQSASVSTLLLLFPVSIFFPIQMSIWDWIR